MELTLSDIHIHPSSHVDPNGFVFTYQGQIFRAIHSEKESFYRRLLENGTLKHLTDNFHLVTSKATDLVIPQAQCSFVFRHEKVEPLTYCVEWCPSMHKQAAVSLLELNLALVERDCLLQDAYPWNILFESVRPVHVDLTSIIPDTNVKLLWPAYQQFLDFFQHPLQLAAMGKGALARLLLRNYIQGIPLQEFNRHLTLSWFLRHPVKSALGRVLGAIEKRSQKEQKMKLKLQDTLEAPTDPVRQRLLRQRFLKGLTQRTRALSLPPVRDPWDEYYANMAGVRQEKKEEILEKLLARLRPGWVLDLGCNVGRYSILAARNHARVISMDSSESCVESLYRKTVSENLSITPVVGDILNPTPAFGFMAGQFPSMIERFRSDVVLCLGLMHHLHINGRQPFDRIASLLNALARKAVIFEYVDREDENIRRLDHGREIEYTLDSVSGELSKFFKLSRFESDRPARALLLCEKS